jgi:hypothetical protein
LRPSLRASARNTSDWQMHRESGNKFPVICPIQSGEEVFFLLFREGILSSLSPDINGRTTDELGCTSYRWRAQQECSAIAALSSSPLACARGRLAGVHALTRVVELTHDRFASCLFAGAPNRSVRRSLRSRPHPSHALGAALQASTRSRA